MISAFRSLLVTDVKISLRKYIFVGYHRRKKNGKAHFPQLELLVYFTAVIINSISTIKIIIGVLLELLLLILNASGNDYKLL